MTNRIRCIASANHANNDFSVSFMAHMCRKSFQATSCRTNSSFHNSCRSFMTLPKISLSMPEIQPCDDDEGVSAAPVLSFSSAYRTS